jgi:hypothetical protein
MLGAWDTRRRPTVSPTPRFRYTSLCIVYLARSLPSTSCLPTHNLCLLPRRLEARWNGGSGTTEICARKGSFERRCSRHPRQQLPPTRTSRIAGLPAGQASARRLRVRAAIVDSKWQRRANTVWNRQIHGQLPVTAVPPPPAAPGRGGGNKWWARRRGGVCRCWGDWGIGWDARPWDECVQVGMYE